MSHLKHLLQDTRDRLWTGRVAVLTGAGISAAAGIPTYRDAGGLWDDVDPRVMATPRAFRKNRNRTWRWYLRRMRAMRAAQPTAAHERLAELGWVNPQVRLFTQNVDGLHERAGSEAHRLHGSLQHYRCLKCGHTDLIPDVFPHGWPYCAECGTSRTRPDVVWFGEGLPARTFQAAHQAFEQADVKLVVGTSSLVTPVAWLPLLGRGRIVEVNPDETELTGLLRAPHDFSIPATADRGLDFLLHG